MVCVKECFIGLCCAGETFQLAHFVFFGWLRGHLILSDIADGSLNGVIPCFVGRSDSQH